MKVLSRTFNYKFLPHHICDKFQQNTNICISLKWGVQGSLLFYIDYLTSVIMFVFMSVIFYIALNLTVVPIWSITQRHLSIKPPAQRQNTMS